MTTEQNPAGLFPRAALSGGAGEAAAGEALPHLNLLTNGLLRLARTTPANNSPAEIRQLADHCLENLQALIAALGIPVTSEGPKA